MTNFLLALSGVDRALLSRTPRETAKYVGIGGAILMTAVLAGVSSAYAFRVALSVPVVLAVFLGVLWGLGILNLDRWIVVATRRQGRWYKDIMMALPRLMLAVVIGAIISEPLVLRVFQGEIDTELQVMQSEMKAEFESDLRENPKYRDLEQRKVAVVELQRELAAGVPVDAVSSHPDVKALSTRLDALSSELAAAEQALACEGLGTCGSGNAGAGPVFAENQARRDRLVEERRSIETALAAAQAAARDQAREAYEKTAASEQVRLESMQRDLAQTERERSAEVREHEVRVGEADGLLARIEALHRLSARHDAMNTARWALFLFILAIECMPVLVKMMMNLAAKGQYERLQELEDEGDHERAVLRLETEQEEARMAAGTALDAAEQKARTELDAHVQATRLVLAAQVDLIRQATEEWRRQQEVRLAADVRQFMQGDISTSGTAHVGTHPRPAPSGPAPDERWQAGVFSTTSVVEADVLRPELFDDEEVEQLLAAADAEGGTTAVPEQPRPEDAADDQSRDLPHP